ncbi:hypothetical protein [Lysobacter sp. GCM10012299]|uniref:hypothetical protein n=1 Tax=Lysobacter sp. GCM10012299 TaxID=3317333 RepID=UPI0036095B84
MTGAIQRGLAGSEGPAQWALSSLVEVLPRKENVAALDGGHDAWGVGTLRIDLRYSEAEHALVNDARERMVEMITHAGLEVTGGGETSRGE